MLLTLYSAGLISLFYIIYFSKQTQLKRKEITTNRLSKGIKSAQTMKNEKKLLFLLMQLPRFST